MNVLVTGGAGYIGSHAALALLQQNHSVTIVDNLYRGHRAVIELLRPFGDVHFVQGSVAESDRLVEILRERQIDTVMHFAALTYVGESVERPLDYYENNVAGVIGLLRAVEQTGVMRFIFSSTCALYGEPDEAHIPMKEDCPFAPVSPYGHSKLTAEQVLRDFVRAGRSSFSLGILRYFNVAGCDPDGRLGEDHDPETHLIPICLEAALGKRRAITIFGTDYATPDGTCIRDYVHVCDLIDAHILAMNALNPGDVKTWNVGIGRGYSVKEVIAACRKITGIDFPDTIGHRRPGDPPVLYADGSRIRHDLGWSPRFTDIESIVETAWAWFRNHPNGYEEG